MFSICLYVFPQLDHPQRPLELRASQKSRIFSRGPAKSLLFSIKHFSAFCATFLFYTIRTRLLYVSANSSKILVLRIIVGSIGVLSKVFLLSFLLLDRLKLQHLKS